MGVFNGSILSISIHAPAKGATYKDGDNTNGESISIHAPAKGATQKTFFDIAQSHNFNPRSREGSDV